MSLVAFVDHIILAVDDLNDAISCFKSQSGVSPAIGGKHLAHGTHNAILSLGDKTYFEFMAVDKENPVPIENMYFRLGEWNLKVPRIVCWVMKSSYDIHKQVQDAWNNGINMGDVQSGSRVLPNGKELSWKVTSPDKRAHELAPFLIEWSAESLSAHPASTSPKGCTLSSLTFEHPNPADFQDLMSKAFNLDRNLFIVKPGEMPCIIATIQTPNGPIELRGNNTKFELVKAKTSLKIADEEDIQWANKMYDTVVFPHTENRETQTQVIAYVNSKRVGCGRLNKYTDERGTLYEMGGIYVVPEARKCGIARSLVEYILKSIPRDMEANVVCLPFNHLSNFYCRFGFIDLGTSEEVMEKLPLELKKKISWCKSTFQETGVTLLSFKLI